MPALSLFRGEAGIVQVDVEAQTVAFTGSFATVRSAQRCPLGGKGYYELEILEIDAAPQYGFAAPTFLRVPGASNNGVGDDAHSWAVDGARQRKWHHAGEPYECTWQTGDVIGLACDLDKMQMHVSLNGSFAAPHGVVFELNPDAVGEGLFAAFSGSRGNVRFNLGEESSGLRPLKHAPPAANFKAFAEFPIVVADADVDKRLSELFGDLDRDGDGVLSLAEFTPFSQAVVSFNIEECDMGRSEEIVQQVNLLFFGTDSNRRLSEGDFKSFLAADFHSGWDDGCLNETEGLNQFLNQIQGSPWLVRARLWKAFGMIGKALSHSHLIDAPIERVKLLLQTQDANPRIASGEIHRYTGIVNCFERVSKEQGTAAFWRGNLANIVRYFPTQFNLAFTDFLQNTFPQYNMQTHFFRWFGVSMASRGLASAASLLIEYPLDFARTRLGADVGKGADREFHGLVDCITKTAKKGGFFSLYQGVGIYIAGIIVYRGAYFFFYDKAVGVKPSNKPALFKFVIVQAVVAASGFASYPFDTVRRRLMMQSGLEEKLYDGALDCFAKIIKNEGINALFKGAGVDLLSGIFGSLVIVSYDLCLCLSRGSTVGSWLRHR
jgi:solute carrier family 25 (adenine nucleotide translocator) protein 4/5/6/31